MKATSEIKGAILKQGLSDCAIIYSIIESCRRHQIEPYTYLRDVLTRLPTMTNRQIKDIVPKAWAAAIKNIVSVTASPPVW